VYECGQHLCLAASESKVACDNQHVARWRARNLGKAAVAVSQAHDGQGGVRWGVGGEGGQGEGLEAHRTLSECV
jgi:hypothetical protein